ncbi:MAG: hypothetical protein U0169_13650 [Polyangiaceae bacterium]
MRPLTSLAVLATSVFLAACSSAVPSDSAEEGADGTSDSGATASGSDGPGGSTGASNAGADGGVLGASKDGGAPPADGGPPPGDGSTSAGVPTLETRTLVPAHGRESGGKNPSDPTALATYLTKGFGELTIGAGEGHARRVIGGAMPPARGPNVKRLVSFVHMPDLQIPDDESPTRTGVADTASLTAGALRPQDPYLCRMTNAAVKTINALHAADPVAFVLLGGDNADSAQTNEVDWVMDILGGGKDVECDSGANDDPTPGPDNDGKDPFRAPGLAMPWKWVTGNHDVLVQGNLVVDASRSAAALGTFSLFGTRDYANGGAVRTGNFVVADPRRALLSREALMAKVAGNGDGHGISAAEVARGKAIYTFDVPQTPLRFLILDTAAETGGAEGILHQADVDAVVKPALDRARTDGKWVVLASHHATDSLSASGGAFGTTQPDAILPEAWKTFVGGYPNVVLSMVGHSHAHRVVPIQPSTGHAYWEMMTSSLADYPHQIRRVEIFDDDNGFLRIRGTCVDLDVSGDPVAEAGRKRGVVDFTSGYMSDGRGTALDRNVELLIAKP